MQACLLRGEPPSLMVFVFAIMPINNMNGANLQHTNAVYVEKLATAVISQTLTEHAYCLCRLMH